MKFCDSNFYIYLKLKNNETDCHLYQILESNKVKIFCVKHYYIELSLMGVNILKTILNLEPFKRGVKEWKIHCYNNLFRQIKIPDF